MYGWRHDLPRPARIQDASKALTFGLRGAEAAGGGVLVPPDALVYQRRSFAWRDPTHPFAQRRLPASGDGTTAVLRSPAAGALHALVAHLVVGHHAHPVGVAPRDNQKAHTFGCAGGHALRGGAGSALGRGARVGLIAAANRGATRIMRRAQNSETGQAALCLALTRHSDAPPARASATELQETRHRPAARLFAV